MKERDSSVLDTGKRGAYRYRGKDGYMTVVDRSEGDDPCWSWRVESPRGVQVAAGWERRLRLAELIGNTVARAIARVGKT